MVGVYVMMYMPVIYKCRTRCPSVIIYGIISIVIWRYPSYIRGPPEVGKYYRAPYIYRFNYVVGTIYIAVTHYLHHYFAASLFYINSGHILVNIFSQYGLY
jgi:hypothetical protein